MERNELIDIEKRLWTNDPEFYEASYLADAVLIFEEVGKIGRTTAVSAIRALNREGKNWAEVSFEDVATLQLAAEAVLLTYTAHARWNYETAPSRYLCSSVYVRKDGRWRVALHQQTNA